MKTFQLDHLNHQTFMSHTSPWAKRGAGHFYVTQVIGRTFKERGDEKTDEKTDDRHCLEYLQDSVPSFWDKDLPYGESF